MCFHKFAVFVVSRELNSHCLFGGLKQMFAKAGNYFYIQFLKDTLLAIIQVAHHIRSNYCQSKINSFQV